MKMLADSASQDAPNTHYLELELLELIRTNAEIFWFLEQGSLDGLWYWDLTDPEHEWLSPRFKEVFGYHHDEVPHTSEWWQKNIHPDDLQIALDSFEAHSADPSVPYDQVVRYLHKDGRTIWVRCRGLIIRDDNGKPIRMLGAHTDVTELKEAEARDAQALDIKQTILDTVLHGIMLFEAIRNSDDQIVDLKMIEANRAALDLIGRTDDEVLSKPLSETFPGNFEDGLFDEYRKALDTQQTVKITRHYQHENLNNWYRIIATPHSSDLLVIGFADITELKAAEQELEIQKEKYRTLYHSTPAIMHSIDRAGNLIDVSDAWMEAFGYDREEVLGKPSTTVLTEESQKFARETVLPAFFEEGRCERVAYKLQRKDGSQFDGELSAVLFGKGTDHAQTFAVIEEVTERNRARRDAEAALSELTVSKERLEKFAYVASHDLQEPLRKIETFANVLIEATQSGNAEEAEYARDVVTRSVGRARNLISDLLAFSRSQNTDIQLNTTRLDEAVRDAWELVAPEPLSNAMSTEIGSVEIEADELKLSMLLSNLLVNAVKYRDPARDLSVNVSFMKTDTGDHVLRIADNGIGFRAEDKSIIFEPFRRLHGQDEVPGSGIGLATCRSICEHHGWKIDAESEPGKGSIFSVFIPQN